MPKKISDKKMPGASLFSESAQERKTNISEVAMADTRIDIAGTLRDFTQTNQEIMLKNEADQSLESSDKEAILSAAKEADDNAQKASKEAEQSILALKEEPKTPVEQTPTAPVAATELNQEKAPPSEKIEKKDTVKKIIQAAIAALTLYCGASGPGDTEADKNKEIASLLKEISSQKNVAKFNIEDSSTSAAEKKYIALAKFVAESFDTIMGGQEAAAAEIQQKPLEQITMDSKELEQRIQASQQAWEGFWGVHPEFKESQTKEFETWAHSALLKDGDKVRILWKTNAQSPPSMKSFKIADASKKESISLFDFFKKTAKELGDAYNPDNILNIEIERDGQKLPGSLGFDPENPACPLLANYLKKYLPKENLEKPDDTPPVKLDGIEPRSTAGEIPTQPFLYVFKNPPGGWFPAEQSPNATIADPNRNIEPSPPPLLPTRTAAIRPAPEIKPQITPGGPPPITIVKIGDKMKPVEKVVEKPKTIEKPADKGLGEGLAEKLTINENDIDAAYEDASWDKLTKKIPSLTINEGLFLNEEDQKNPQLVENFKNLIISKGEQKLKEIESDLAKNFYFPAESLNDQKAIYNFAQKNLKEASKENKVAFFLLINSHKRILDLRAEYK